VATLRAIEAGSELAHVVAEKADTPNLTGPARALSRRAHNDVESGLASPPAEGDVVWVSPADILAKRMVLLPPPVAETLRAASDATIEATSTASAVATLHQRDAASAGSMPDRDRGRMPEERPVEFGRSAPGPRR
jgi:hypothetical protein